MTTGFGCRSTIGIRGAGRKGFRWGASSPRGVPIFPASRTAGRMALPSPGQGTGSRAEEPATFFRAAPTDSVQREVRVGQGRPSPCQASRCAGWGAGAGATPAAPASERLRSRRESPQAGQGDFGARRFALSPAEPARARAEPASRLAEAASRAQMRAVAARARLGPRRGRLPALQGHKRSRGDGRGSGEGVRIGSGGGAGLGAGEGSGSRVRSGWVGSG